MAGSPVQLSYPSINSRTERARVRSTSPAPAARLRAAINWTTETLAGYVSDGEEGKSKSFFRFRPKSRTEKYGGNNRDQHRGEELGIPPRVKTSHARDRADFRIPQSPLSRQPIFDLDETSIGTPISPQQEIPAPTRDPKIVVPIPTLSWRHPVLLANEHNLQVSPTTLDRLPLPAHSKQFRLNPATSEAHLPAPKSENLHNESDEMVPRRPATASGSIEHGISFSREASAPPPVPTRSETAFQPSASRSRPRRAAKDVAAGESTSQVQMGRDRALVDELKQKNVSRDAAFVFKNGKKHHRYNAKEVPFPRNYDRLVLDHEVWEALFYEQLVGGISYVRFETPPERVLDIGCGPGAWIINTAKVWKNSHFFGLDIVPIQPDLTCIDPDLADRITWVHANYLDKLPFPDNYFDFVMIKRTSRTVPEDKLNSCVDELLRILKPGCPVEVLEEDLFFPGSRKAEPEDSAKSSDASTRSTLSIDSAASVLSEATYTQTSVPSSYSLPTVGDDLSKRLSLLNERLKLKQSDAHYRETNMLRMSTAATVYWHGQSHPYVPDSDQVTPSPTQDENVARRYHTQDVTRSSPMNDRPIFNRATSDLEATTSKYNLTIARTLSLDANGPSYRNDISQGTLLPRRSQSRSASHSTSTDAIESGNDVISDIRAGSRIQKSSGMDGRVTNLRDDGEGPSRRSKSIDLYHPSVGQPLNPRDHSLLERIYNEMHADRFINLMPLSIFSMAMETIFTRTSSTAPISFAFPPRPKKRYFDEGFTDEYDPLLLTFDNGDVDRAIVQYAHNTVTSGRNADAKYLGEVQTQSSISRADELASQYVIIDNARLPAAPTRRPRACVSTKSVSNGSLDTIAMSPMRSARSPLSRSDDNMPIEQLDDSRSESPLMFASAPGSETASDESLPTSALVLAQTAASPPPIRPPSLSPDSPEKSLEIDLKSLHMHLSLRVAETLACAEAMWEWVLAEQERYVESQNRRRHRGPSYAIDEEEDLQMTAIREMSRADFDSCLSRFEMDMQDNIALDHALDQYLHIKPQLAPNRSAERRSFDTACAAWDALHGTELGQSDAQSSNSGVGDSKYLSRTMRIYSGYKPMW